MLMSLYEEYVMSFYEELKRQGVEPSQNALRDLMLGIPRPVTREVFMERLLNTMYPLAEAGFKYLKRTRRGGRKGAEARRADTSREHGLIEAAARDLLKTRQSRRGLAARVRLRLGCDLSERQINNILKARRV